MLTKSHADVAVSVRQTDRQCVTWTGGGRTLLQASVDLPQHFRILRQKSLLTTCFWHSDLLTVLTRFELFGPLDPCLIEVAAPVVRHWHAHDHLEVLARRRSAAVRGSPPSARLLHTRQLGVSYLVWRLEAGGQGGETL